MSAFEAAKHLDCLPPWLISLSVTVIFNLESNVVVRFGKPLSIADFFSAKPLSPYCPRTCSLTQACAESRRISCTRSRLFSVYISAGDIENIEEQSIFTRYAATGASPLSCVRLFSYTSTLSQTKMTLVSDPFIRGGNNFRPLNVLLTEKAANLASSYPCIPGPEVFGLLDALNLPSRSYNTNLFAIREALDPVATKLASCSHEEVHPPASH